MGSARHASRGGGRRPPLRRIYHIHGAGSDGIPGGRAGVRAVGELKRLVKAEASRMAAG